MALLESNLSAKKHATLSGTYVIASWELNRGHLLLQNLVVNASACVCTCTIIYVFIDVRRYGCTHTYTYVTLKYSKPTPTTATIKSLHTTRHTDTSVLFYFLTGYSNKLRFKNFVRQFSFVRRSSNKVLQSQSSMCFMFLLSITSVFVDKTDNMVGPWRHSSCLAYVELGVKMRCEIWIGKKQWLPI